MGRVPIAFVFGLTALLLAACGPARTYSGPRMPRDQTAVLRVWGTGTDVGQPGDTRYTVSIRTLDGVPYRGMKSILEVLPGPHVLELRWHKMVSPYRLGDDVHADTYAWRTVASGTVTLEIDAEAGESYELEWLDDSRHVPPGPPLGFKRIER